MHEKGQQTLNTFDIFPANVKGFLPYTNSTN